MPDAVDDIHNAAKMMSGIAERMRADRIPMPLEHYAQSLEYYAKCLTEAAERHQWFGKEATAEALREYDKYDQNRRGK